MKKILLTLILTFGAAGVASAQVAIDATTLTTTMTVATDVITIGSATCTGCTFGSGTVIYVDNEAMVVRSSYVSGTTNIPVLRAQLGTKRSPHSSSVLAVAKVVFVGPPNRFHGGSGTGDLTGDPPLGSCAPRTQWQFLPWINVNNGVEWVCDGQDWRALVNYNVNGTGPSR